ncbi:MAG: DUF502 domain-containing protein [Rhodospirillales bacterium]|nr:DUF502 domain-containing protein [Rhodospirillales bacterium]
MSDGPVAQPIPALRIGLVARLRAYFLAGILVTAPVGLTVYLAWKVIQAIDEIVRSILPASRLREFNLDLAIPGMGLAVALVGLTLIGFLTANFLGRSLVRFSDAILARMPVIRGLHGAIKQILETVLAKKSQAFREVVLIEYPRPGIWTLAFLTSPPPGEIVRATGGAELAAVFVPTTPNPTSGFLLFLPRTAIRPMAMTVEDGLKYVVSGGLVAPSAAQSSPNAAS